MKTTLWMLLCLAGVVPALAAAQPPRQSTGVPIRYWSREWDFEQVSVQQLADRLESIGLDLPVELQGIFSAQLTVGVPWNDLRNPRSWRFGGSLTSTELLVDDLTFNDVELALNYRDGALVLDPLRLNLTAAETDDGQPVDAGLVQGNASLQLIPRGDFQATISVTDLTITEIAERLGLAADLSGRISGNLQATAPVNQLRTATAWKISGPISVADLQAGNIQPISGSLQFELADGFVTASQLNVASGETTVTGTAQLNTQGNQDWTANATVSIDQLDELLTAVAAFTGDAALASLSQRVTGQVRSNLTAAGSLITNQRQLQGTANLTNVTIDWTPDTVDKTVVQPPGRIDSAELAFAIDGQQLTVSDLTARIAQGKISGAGSWPWDVMQTVQAQVTFQNVPVSGTAAGPVSGSGVVSGQVRLRVARGQISDPAAWTASGSLSGGGLTVADWPVENLQLEAWSIDQGRLSIPAFALVTDSSQWDGSAQLNLQAPYELQSSLVIRSASLQRIARLTGLPDKLRGQASGTFSIQGPVQQLQDLSAFRISGPVSVAALRWDDSQPVDGTFQLQLQDGVLTGNQISLATEAITLNADARLQLIDDQDWNLTGRLTAREMTNALTLIAALVDEPVLNDWSSRVDGQLQTSLTAEGQAGSGRFQISGQAELQQLDLTWPADSANEWRVQPPTSVSEATFNYGLTDAALDISELQARLLDGQISGSATWPLTADGQVQLSAAFRDLNFAEVLRSPVSSRGPITGEARFQAPRDRLTDPAAWTASGQLLVQELNLGGWPLQQLQLNSFSIADGVLKLPSLTAVSDGHPWQAGLQIQLQTPYEFESEFDVQQVSLPRIARVTGYAELSDRLSGDASLTGTASGQLSEIRVRSQGKLSAASLGYAGTQLLNLQLNYEIDPAALRIQDLTAATDAGGQIAANVTVPLDQQTAGQIDSQWSDLDLVAVAAAVADLPQPISGQSSGQLQASIPAGTTGDPFAWEGSAELQLPELTVNSVPLADVQITASQSQRQLTWQVLGQVLNGQLTGSGRRQHGSVDGTSPASGSGQILISDADPGPLWRALNADSTQPLPVSGSLQLRIPWKETATGLLWAAELRTGTLLLGQQSFSTGFVARVAGTSQRLQLAEFSGELAGGTVRATEGWIYDESQRPLTITARRIDLDRLLQLIPGAEDLPVGGPVDLRVRVQPGRRWRFLGTASSASGQAAGVVVSDVNLPFSGEWIPETGHLWLRLKQSRLAAARGRLYGDLMLRKNSAWSVDGDYRFQQLELASLPGLSSSRFGQGRISGHLSVQGREIQSLNDLNADIVADLRDTRMRSMPLVSRIQSVVPGAQGGGQFETGHLEARLSSGQLTVSELSLSGPRMQMFVTGIINNSGRLRLDAVVATGQQADTFISRLLFSQLATAAYPPAALLLLANDFVSNRVTHLAVTGTIQRPIVRLKAQEALQQEVLRFMLRQYTTQAPAIPGAP